MSYQLNFLDAIAEGERLRDRGMQRAVDHADKETPQWSVKAYNLFLTWLKEGRPRKHFKGEDFRIYCELGELIEKPPSDRAYGSIMIRAAKAGLIKKIGHATTVNPKAHRCFCSLWEKV